MPANDDWTEPGVHQVADGVHRIPLPLPNDGLRAVNVYAIEDADGLVLVDSGWSIPVARDLLDRALKALDATVGDIRRFLITHVHRDHYTQAITIRREAGTPVALGHEEAPSLAVIRDGGHEPMGPQIRQLRECGGAELADALAALLASSQDERDRSIWEEPDEWLHEGTVTLEGGRALDVVETPGHTRGHVVFHDPRAALLFAGDHVLPTITPSIGFEGAPTPNPLGDFLASLAKVRAMPDAMLLPAHGQVTGSVHARVDELVDHHGRRLEEMAGAVDRGATSAYDAARSLLWTRRGRSFADLDVFNQMMATGETAAHLDLLAATGRLRRAVDDEGILRYEPA